MLLIFFLIYSYRVEIANLFGNLNIELSDNLEENINIILNGTFLGNNEETYTDEEIQQMLKSTETMIDGEYAAYYYDKDLFKGHVKIQDFIIANNLELEWFDCGTPMLVAKTPKCNF